MQLQIQSSTRTTIVWNHFKPTLGLRPPAILNASLPTALLALLLARMPTLMAVLLPPCLPASLRQVWVKPSAEMQFLYGNHVLKNGLGRITEGTPSYTGVVVYSMSGAVPTHLQVVVLPCCVLVVEWQAQGCQPWILSPKQALSMAYAAAFCCLLLSLRLPACLQTCRWALASPPSPRQSAAPRIPTQ